MLKTLSRLSAALLTLALCPLSAEISIIGDLLEQFESSPGAESRGSFTIRNIGQTDESVRIFLTDYTYKADGTTHYHEDNPDPAHNRSNVEWISLDTQKALIAPGEERTVHYSVKVPTDKPLVGTYWSIMIVEPEVQIKETDKGVSLTPIFRYAVQVMNHFRDGAKANLKVENASIAPVEPHPHEHALGTVDPNEPKRVEFVLDVANDGDLGLNAEITCTLLDKNGTTVFEGKHPKSWLLPDCSNRTRFDVTHLPSGKYSGMFTMDAGGENYFGSRQEVVVP